MQDKSTPQVKTPGKKNRKSIANSSPNKQNGVDSTPVSKKNAEGKLPLTPFVKAGDDSAPATTPNKKKNANTPKPAKTPKQNVENTSEAAPAQTPNTAGGKQKRKQSLAAAGEESPAKQQKPAENAGGKQKRKQSLAAAEEAQSSPAKQQKPAENGKQKRKQSSVANGDGAPSPKQKKLEKVNGTPKLENSDDDAEKAQKKQEKLQKRKSKRNSIKKAFDTLKEGGQLDSAFVSSIQATLLKLEKLAATQQLTKTANKKLSTYRKLQKKIEEIGGSKLEEVKQRAAVKSKQKQQVKKEKQGKKEKVNKKVEKDDDEEANESNEEEESEDEEAENESGDEEEEDEEEEEEEEKPAKAPAKNKGKGGEQGNKTRYVLFVGNLPFDATNEEITEHFSKVAKVTSLRRLEKNGFGHIELADRESYEKSLSLNHTFIKGRRINVEYSKPSSQQNGNPKFSKDLKKKNFKLQGMRKQGLLAGSVKEDQKRSARRTKQRAVQA